MLGGRKLEDGAVTTIGALLRDPWGQGLGESVFGEEEAGHCASEHSNVPPPPSDTQARACDVDSEHPCPRRKDERGI